MSGFRSQDVEKHGLCVLFRLIGSKGSFWRNDVQFCRHWSWLIFMGQRTCFTQTLRVYMWKQVTNCHVVYRLRNCMVARCCICILVCCIMHSPFILEQPGSSLLEHHPLFQMICKKYCIYKVPQLHQGKSLEWTVKQSQNVAYYPFISKLGGHNSHLYVFTGLHTWGIYLAGILWWWERLSCKWICFAKKMFLWKTGPKFTNRSIMNIFRKKPNPWVEMFQFIKRKNGCFLGSRP